jgi:hypothetical protein
MVAGCARSLGNTHNIRSWSLEEESPLRDACQSACSPCHLPQPVHSLACLWITTGCNGYRQWPFSCLSIAGRIMARTCVFTPPCLPMVGWSTATLCRCWQGPPSPHWWSQLYLLDPSRQREPSSSWPASSWTSSFFHCDRLCPIRRLLSSLYSVTSHQSPEIYWPFVCSSRGPSSWTSKFNDRRSRVLCKVIPWCKSSASTGSLCGPLH